DAEAKRKAAEAEQQRAKEEQQRQAQAAADAEAKRKAAEAEQQRLAAVKAEEERKAKAEAEGAARSALLPQSATTVAKAPFEIRTNVEAISPYAVGPSPRSGSSAYWSSWESAMSTGECETICARSPACKIFSYNKNWQLCYMYSNATLAPNSNFD